LSEVIKAAIYARYSSHAQGEQSIEAQIAEGHKYAASKGYTVVQEYIDRAVSGRTDNRAEFQRMLRDLPKGAFTVLILWKIDRFGRNREEIAINKARCKKHGVHPEYIAETIPDTPEGVILESVLEGFAEYYSLQLSQNVKRGRRASAEKCLSVGSPAPFGYKTVDKRYVIDDDTVDLAKGIFDKYASGLTMSEIVADLNERGSRTRTGKPWGVENVRKILKNERYTGIYILGDIRVAGGMPQIISRETWEKVQDMMVRNKKSPNHSWSRSDFLLTGKIFCGECGGPVTGASGRGRNGDKHDYYACQYHRKRHTCEALPIRKEAVENAVLDAVNDLLDDDALLEWIADQAYAVLEESNRELDQSQLIKKRIGEIDKSLENLFKAIESGLYSPSMNDRINGLEVEKKALEGELAAQEASKALRLTRDHILYFLFQIRNKRTDSRESQQRLIDVFVNRVYLGGDGRITIHLNHSSDCSSIPVDLAKSTDSEPADSVRLLRPSVHHKLSENDSFQTIFLYTMHKSSLKTAENRGY